MVAGIITNPCLLRDELQSVVTETSNADEQEHDTFQECGSECLLEWDPGAEADVGGVGGARWGSCSVQDGEGSRVCLVTSAFASNTRAGLISSRKSGMSSARGEWDEHIVHEAAK